MRWWDEKDDGDIWEPGSRRPAVESQPAASNGTPAMPSRRPRAYLVEQRVGGGRRLALPPESDFVLGSAGEVDFKVHDPLVESTHAAIRPARTRYFVEVLSPGSLTFVNEERVVLARRLDDGDRLRLGSTVFVIQYLPGESA